MYAIVLPVFYILKNRIGIEYEFVYTTIQIVTFLFVYGVVSAFVHVVLKRINDNLRLARKNSGGRDIKAEEEHETEAGLINLNISGK